MKTEARAERSVHTAADMNELLIRHVCCCWVIILHLNSGKHSHEICRSYKSGLLAFVEVCALRQVDLPPLHLTAAQHDQHSINSLRKACHTRSSSYWFRFHRLYLSPTTSVLACLSVLETHNTLASWQLHGQKVRLCHSCTSPNN